MAAGPLAASYTGLALVAVALEVAVAVAGKRVAVAGLVVAAKDSRRVALEHRRKGDNSPPRSGTMKTHCQSSRTRHTRTVGWAGNSTSRRLAVTVVAAAATGKAATRVKAKAAAREAVPRAAAARAAILAAIVAAAREAVTRVAKLVGQPAHRSDVVDATTAATASVVSAAA